jgi:hypothetical protein
MAGTGQGGNMPADDTYLNFDTSQGYVTDVASAIPMFQVASPGGAPSATPGFNWGGIVTSIANTGLSIAKDVYGGPQPGTYIRTPQGGIYYRAASGTSPSVMPTDLGATFGSSGLLMWGILGLGAVLIISKMGH